MRRLSICVAIAVLASCGVERRHAGVDALPVPVPDDVDAPPPPVDAQWVECGGPTDCSGATPVCGADHVCRGCAIDDECVSAACDFDTGACYPEDSIVYVRGGGANTAGCGAPGNPCGSLAAAVPALDVSRPIIRMLPGPYAAQRINGADVPILIHAAGATATAKPTDVAAVTVATDAQLVLHDLAIEIVPPPTGDALHGIQIAPGANAELHRVVARVEAPNGIGIESRGSLIADQLQVRSVGLAIHATGDVVVLRRSRVTQSSGGVYVGARTFELVNNVIDHNRGVGVVIDSSGGGVLAFNSFIANGSETDRGPTELVVIRPGSAALEPVANLLSSHRPYSWDPSTESGVTLVDPAVAAVMRSSLFDQSGFPIAIDTNVYASARVTFAGRLEPDSPAIDAVLADVQAPEFDVDRDPRPTGSRADIGADEYVP